MLRFLLCAALLAGAAKADCEKDSDCKGGRACVSGQCVERKSCFKDVDCPGAEVCENSKCVPPSGPPSGWGGATRATPPPQWTPGRAAAAAAENAGMALLYTKETWPLSIVDRPLVVAPGMAEGQLGVEKDVSADFGQKKRFLADGYARYGVSDRIHAGIDFLAVCFSDCPGDNFLQALSFLAGYAVIAEHDQNLVPQVGLSIFNSSSAGAVAGLQLSFLYAYRLNNNVQLAATGGLFLGVIGRDNTPAPDIGVIRVEPRFELIPRFSVAPYLGLAFPFAHTDLYEVPLGIEALYVADRRLDIGASFEFDDIAARLAPGSTDLRSLRIFGVFRL